MRRTPPQNKGEKTSSPRVTLRLHQIKSKDEKRAAKAAADVVSYESRAQFSISMDGKNTSSEDVYEFKGKDIPGRASSLAVDTEEEEDSSQPSTDTSVNPLRHESSSDHGTKRAFTDVAEGGEEGDEDPKRKKRKDTECGKENTRSSNSGRVFGGRNGNSKCPKNATDTKSGCSSNSRSSYNSGNTERKSPNSTSVSSTSKLGGSSGASVVGSSKSLASLSSDNDCDGEETRTNKSISSTDNSNSINAWTGGLKVPPLKIVIPQQNSSMEQDQGSRNGKNGTARHHPALPYVVASNNDTSIDKESSGPCGPSSTSSGRPSPTESSGSGKGEDKKDPGGGSLTSEDHRSTYHQRVLRSSHRSSGGHTSSHINNGVSTAAVSSSTNSSSSSSASGSTASSPSALGSNVVLDRGSNLSSPQQSSSHQQSPSPVESTTPVTMPESSATCATKGTSSSSTASPSTEEKSVDLPEQSSHQQTTFTPQQPPAVDLHPRKRKLKQNKENQISSTTTSAPLASASTAETVEASSTSTETQQPEQPVDNCYQLFLNIRKQVDRRRKGLFPVQPKPPQGFKDYLMNRCTYVLAGNASSRIPVSMASPPANLQVQMKDLFTDQEKERYRLRIQHVIEKEKLVLSVEQEILRVHGRAARALANQSLPFSVCTILKDEEIYNVISPEQEEKDRNARSRYNGRLFLSWLQDVDDKWEKIKEGMLIRHHIEAESLHAVQCMDWEWKMKEHGICEFKAHPVIDEFQVPMVHVSDDFDLLPA